MIEIVERLCARLPLTPLAAGMLSAAHLGIARDSSSFARLFGLAHALVLREVALLSDEGALIEVEDRGERSQRLFYRLTPRAEALLAEGV